MTKRLRATWSRPRATAASSYQTAHRSMPRHALALREPAKSPTKLYNIADNITDNVGLRSIEIYRLFGIKYGGRRRPFPHRTRLVRRRNRGQKLDNDRTESARLQRDAVSPQDWFSNARRAAAEGARDSGALANARAIRTVARRGGRAAALYPS